MRVDATLSRVTTEQAPSGIEIPRMRRPARRRVAGASLAVAIIMVTAAITRAEFLHRHPDLASLLVPAPAGSTACFADGARYDGSDVSLASDPVGAALAGPDAHASEVVIRCWTTSSGEEVDVFLVRFEDAVAATGLTSTLDLTGVTSHDPLTVQGTVGSTAYVVSGSAGIGGPAPDEADLDGVAADQAARLSG